MEPLQARSKMQQKSYAQVYEMGLGSLIGDFFQNVKDTVKGVAKAVAPIAPFAIPFLAPALAGTGIGGLLGGGVGKFLTSRLGQAALGAGIGALAGQKPSEIAKNLALQTATTGIQGILDTTKGQGTLSERFMSGVRGVELPKVTNVPVNRDFASAIQRDINAGNISPNTVTEALSGASSSLPPEPEKNIFQKAFSAINPADRSVNPDFIKTKKFAELTGSPLSDEAIEALGIPKDASFTYQYGPALYTAFTATPILEQYLGPKEEEFETTTEREDLYTPNYAQYQLLDITGPEGIAPLLVAEGGEVTGFAENGGKKIQHPEGDIKEHPKRIGEIVGPGTGTSDDIPAMLSDGEFVMTAKAVRNAGGGSRKEGAKNMYKMMKSLEKGGSLSQQSIGMA